MEVTGEAKLQLMRQVHSSMRSIVVKVSSGGDLTPVEQLIWDVSCAAVEEIVVMHANGQGGVPE